MADTPSCWLGPKNVANTAVDWNEPASLCTPVWNAARLTVDPAAAMASLKNQKELQFASPTTFALASEKVTPWAWKRATQRRRASFEYGPLSGFSAGVMSSPGSQPIP